MRFLKNLIKSNHDIKGETALLVHVLAGCNLRCYGCHNVDMIINTDSYETATEDEILEKISEIGDMFDNLIISGGEATLYSNLQSFLENVRKVYYGKIILYSNGQNHDIISKLIRLNLVDGIHMDVKYNVFIERENDTIRGSCSSYANEVSLSLSLINNSNIAKNSIFRTVKYPRYTEEYLNELKKHMDLLFKNVKYEQNEFVEPEYTPIR